MTITRTALCCYCNSSPGCQCHQVMQAAEEKKASFLPSVTQLVLHCPTSSMKQKEELLTLSPHTPITSCRLLLGTFIPQAETSLEEHLLTQHSLSLGIIEHSVKFWLIQWGRENSSLSPQVKGKQFHWEAFKQAVAKMLNSQLHACTWALNTSMHLFWRNLKTSLQNP